MHLNDWHQRWQENRIGFHESEVNPYLIQFIGDFNLQPGVRIFMPLCGKSLDIAWLAEQGFEVIGVEISPLAIEAFFTEQGLDFSSETQGDFRIYRAGRITLIEGDYFALEPEQIGAIDWIYDRASLIAIPAPQRADYVRQLRRLAGESTPMLLITLAYDQSIMKGPPFSVQDDEVRQHYAANYRLDWLASSEEIEERPRWREAGLTSLMENAIAVIPMEQS